MFPLGSKNCAASRNAGSCRLRDVMVGLLPIISSQLHYIKSIRSDLIPQETNNSQHQRRLSGSVFQGGILSIVFLFLLFLTMSTQFLKCLCVCEGKKKVYQRNIKSCQTVEKLEILYLHVCAHPQQLSDNFPSPLGIQKLGLGNFFNFCEKV